MSFQLKSAAFNSGKPIPGRYTKNGGNVSPPLQWSDPPPEAKSLVLVVEDPDAVSGLFVHWSLYDIATDRGELPEGIGSKTDAEDLAVAVNGFGQAR